MVCPSGWSVEFSLERDGASSSEYSALNSPKKSLNTDDAAISVVPGLHCGPAGRQTLIKWIEDNYKLRKKTQYSNPGALACRLWQESQGFSDPVAKAIVDLLKLNGVPANVTYKEVFEKHLSKLLSTLIKKSADNEERLTALAEKMVAMFQVTEIQPMLCDVLDKLDDIPQFARAKLLANTSSANNFFKIVPIGVKRKLLAASPAKLYATVAPLIEDALFLLDLGIKEEDMKGNVLYKGFHEEYKSIIAEIVNLIGPPKTHTSRVIYFLVQQTIRVMFTRSVLATKSAATRAEKKKDIEYGVWFGDQPFDASNLSRGQAQNDDSFNAYRRHAENSIGILYNLEENADETVKSVSEMRYSGSGCWNLSAIRHSITTLYQETYLLQPEEMQAMEPFISLTHIITCIGDSNVSKLPMEMLQKLAKPSKESKPHPLKIRDDMELFDVAFMLSNPIVASGILSHVLHYVDNTSAVLLSAQTDIHDWLSLLALGLSAHHIAATKFLMEVDLQLSGRNADSASPTFAGESCVSTALLRAAKSTGKPVSVAKLISYVYPVDRTVRVSEDVPPILSNVMSVKNAQRDSDPAKTAGADEDEMAFHELLVLYLPRVNIERLRAFIADCAAFCRATETYAEEEAYAREATIRIRSILESFDESVCDPKDHLQRAAAIVEKRAASTEPNRKPSVLERLHSKFKFINRTVMCILATTANVTNLFMKMMAVRIIASCVQQKVSRPVVKPVLYEKIKRINLIRLRAPTDYIWLCLIRIGFCAMNLLEFDSLTEFIANVTNQGQLCAFLPLYTLAARRGESKAIHRHIDSIHRYAPPEGSHGRFRVGQQLFRGQENSRKMARYTCACKQIEEMYNT
ncbi:hypothetical protein, conserved [Babesia bigemina]|uniref:Uncharacterized protein n=1 Tax=Babesia bigemina TaxID=5866 RepID=A0A061D2S6_BABBI|nr:hypothetical protein, conserved [Babesia bigemina]CDR94377.1 hypothetical protein, conserved [Babesia bigemina]|eukprot:XP_012766563.1 hypothetical protein, conserved [Babesia bigemina]